MFNDLINHILPSVEHFRGGGYWIAFFAALLETTAGIGLILPGSTIILILGALAARGYLDLGDLIWFAVLGAIIGDNVNFSLGRRFGVRWLHNGIWFIKPSHLEKSRHFMDKHGAKSIFLGRFIPSLKEVMPFIAGSIRMNVKTFMFWNVLGAIGWGFQWVLAGYVFAHSLNLAELWLSRAGLFLAVVLLLGTLLYGAKWFIIKNGKDLYPVVRSLWISAEGAFLGNEHIHAWIGRHSKITTFLHTRLDNSTFTGLPLSILILAFIYVLALFGGIVEDLITSDPIVFADIRVANLIAVFRSDGLATVFTWITLLGKSQVVIVVIAAATVLLLIWRRNMYILPLLIAVTGSEIFTSLGKLTFHRPRPEMAIFAESSFSFPSGHATIAVALYGFISYILIRLTPSWQRKVNIFFTGILMILAIGLSRIYLGVHYLSDVWSGYLVGAMWLIIAISICEWLKDRAIHNEPPASMRMAGPISIALVGTTVLFFVAFALHYHPSVATGGPNTMTVASDVADIFANDHMRYTESVIGEKQEPLNFIIVAKDDRQLIDTLKNTGWINADQVGAASFIKVIQSLVLKTPYPSAPVSPSFWNARTQNFSFVKPDDKNISPVTHHLRIWRTSSMTKEGTPIFAGLVNAVAGTTWGIVPKISADLDSERESLYRDLIVSGKVRSLGKKQLVQPQIGKNFIGDQFFTDGKAYMISLL
mgnify:CR=1 FL=1